MHYLLSVGLTGEWYNEGPDLRENFYRHVGLYQYRSNGRADCG